MWKLCRWCSDASDNLFILSKANLVRFPGANYQLVAEKVGFQQIFCFVDKSSHANCILDWFFILPMKDQCDGAEMNELCIHKLKETDSRGSRPLVLPVVKMKILAIKVNPLEDGLEGKSILHP